MKDIRYKVSHVYGPGGWMVRVGVKEDSGLFMMRPAAVWEMKFQPPAWREVSLGVCVRDRPQSFLDPEGSIGPQETEDCSKPDAEL